MINEESCDCGPGSASPVNVIGKAGANGWTPFFLMEASSSETDIVSPVITRDVSGNVTSDNTIKIAFKLVDYIGGTTLPKPTVPPDDACYFQQDSTYGVFSTAVNYKGAAGPAGNGTDITIAGNDLSVGVISGDENDNRTIDALELITGDKLRLTNLIIRWIKARIAAVQGFIYKTNLSETPGTPATATGVVQALISKNPFNGYQFAPTVPILTGDSADAFKYAQVNSLGTAYQINTVPVVTNQVDTPGDVIPRVFAQFTDNSGRLIDSQDDIAPYMTLPGMDNVAKTPTSPGIAGLMSINSGFLYIGSGDNTWVRVAVTTSW